MDHYSTNNINYSRETTLIANAKSDLQQSSMNYSRDYSFTHNFKTYKNNVTITPADQPNTYDFSFSGGNPSTGLYHGFFTQTGNTNNPSVLEPGSVNALPFNTITDDPNANYTYLFMIMQLPDNQLMWANGGFRGLQSATSK